MQSFKKIKNKKITHHIHLLLLKVILKNYNTSKNYVRKLDRFWNDSTKNTVLFKILKKEISFHLYLVIISYNQFMLQINQLI